MLIYLYKATNNEKYLWRALKFQEFVLDTPIVSSIFIYIFIFLFYVHIVILFNS